MDSLFFNITDLRFKVTQLYKEKEEYIKRADISNGLVFFDISLDKEKSFHIKGLDRMVAICVVKSGSYAIKDNLSKRTFFAKDDEIDIFCSTRQDLSIYLHKEKDKKSEIFILAISDFFLKRYLSFDQNEPIDLLYDKTQSDISLERVNKQPIDALTLYLIRKMIKCRSIKKMRRISCEHSVKEFIMHRFSLIDIIDENIDEDELSIALRAKETLLKNFISPPTIETLAHICATNSSKLKSSFKRVHNMTVYRYIQKLRLEEANLLLKESNMNIGEIAKEVGYRHQGHFSKLFYKCYGVYPKDLQKR